MKKRKNVHSSLSILAFGLCFSLPHFSVNAMTKALDDGKDVNLMLFKALENNANSADIEALLMAGASVNAPDHRDKHYQDCQKIGERPLHIAVRTGNVEYCKLLLEKMADVNALDSQGQTPLFKLSDAPKDKALPLAQLLIQHHADVLTEDRKKRTILSKAAMGGQSEVCRFLLGHACAIPQEIEVPHGMAALSAEKSRNLIFTILLCLHRYKVPRVIQQHIVTQSREFSYHWLNACLPLMKLHQKVPRIGWDMIADYITGYTLQVLRCKASTLEKDGHIGFEDFYNDPWMCITLSEDVKDVFNPELMHERYGKLIYRGILKRLQRGAALPHNDTKKLL